MCKVIPTSEMDMSSKIKVCKNTRISTSLSLNLFIIISFNLIDTIVPLNYIYYLHHSLPLTSPPLYLNISLTLSPNISRTLSPNISTTLSPLNLNLSPVISPSLSPLISPRLSPLTSPLTSLLLSPAQEEVKRLSVKSHICQNIANIEKQANDKKFKQKFIFCEQTPPTSALPLATLTPTPRNDDDDNGTHDNGNHGNHDNNSNHGNQNINIKDHDNHLQELASLEDEVYFT